MRANRFWLGIGCTVLLVWSAACGDEQVQRVVPSIRVVSTHVTEDGRHLIDYGPVPVLVRETKELLLRNVGGAPLRITAVRLESGAGVFHVETLPEDGITIATGGERPLPVTFQPPDETFFEGRLVIEHNDRNEPPVEVELRGEGSTVGRIEVEPLRVDFGRVGQGEREVRSIRIHSGGTARLVVEELLLDGAAEFSFVGSTTTPAELPPGSFVDLIVACEPTGDSPADEPLSGTVTISSTDPERRQVEVELRAEVNQAPVAAIGELAGNPAPGDAIPLDGSASYDPDGDDPIEFAWRIYRRPLGSSAFLDDPTSPTPVLHSDLPGEYVVGLDVADAEGLSCLHPDGNPDVPCATRTIGVKPADDVVIELVWDHLRTDLDLHLLEAGFDLGSSKDCSADNPSPDFGVSQDLRDDPLHLGDDLEGEGPERILFSKPSPGRYEVVVRYAKTNSSRTEDPTTATVRVYVYGVLEAEMRRTLNAPGDRWDALAVVWPPGTGSVIDPIDRFQPASELSP